MTVLPFLVVAVPHGLLAGVAGEFARHGYLIVFALVAAESFGSPLPGELSLLAGAYEAQRGIFTLPSLILVAIAAAMVGDNLAYIVGRRAGRPLAERLSRLAHVRPVYLERLDAYFGRHAGRTLLIARQLSPVRGLAALSAGTSQLPWRRFALFNALGCVVWATVVSLLASLLVGHLDELADDLGLAGLAVVALIAAVSGVAYWRHVRRRGAQQRSARATPRSADRREPCEDAGEAEERTCPLQASSKLLLGKPEGAAPRVSS